VEKIESFSDRIRNLLGEDTLHMCYACGTCVSRCMVQERVEASFNPRRLIKKTVLNLEQDAFTDKTVWLCTACDLCYTACPQQIHISDILLAVRKLAIEAGHLSFIRTAAVDGQTCVACGLCVAVCPYEAISLKEMKVLAGNRIIAKVDSDLCMGCGLCGSQCRSSSIGIKEDFSDEDIMDELRQWMLSMDSNRFLAKTEYIK
jgi:heterodisulfide reductase subunit C